MARSQRRSAGFAPRGWWCLISTICLLSAGPARLPAQPTSREFQATIDSFTDADGTGYFAFLLQAPNDPGEPRAVDLALILDLSASQSGEPYRQTIAVLHHFTRGLQGGSRVQIWLTGNPDTPVLRRPSAVGSDLLRKAVADLERLSPTGISNLARTLDSVEGWLGDHDGSLPKVVIYVGGKPTPPHALFGTTLTPERIDLLVKRFVDSGAVCHEIAVFPPAEALRGMLGPLPARSGGLSNSAAEFLERSAKEGITPWIRAPWRVTEWMLGPEVQQVVPSTMAPVAPGGTALLVGTWKPAESLSFELQALSDADHTVRQRGVAVLATAGEANVFLKDLVERWSRVASAGPWTDGKTALEVSRRAASVRSEWILSQAQAALARRQLPLAEDLYQLALAIEPADLEASAGLNAVAQLRSSPDPRQTAVEPNPRIHPDGESTKSERESPQPGKATSTTIPDPLEEAKAREKVEAQRLQLVVRDTVAESQRLARANPAAATRLLKGTLAALESSDGSRTNHVALLKNRVEQQLRVVARQQQRSEEEQRMRDRANASVDARRRVEHADLAREQTTKELMARYQSLLDTGDFTEAERVADQVVANDPQSLVGRAGQWRAILARHYTESEQNEAVKREQWWRALASIEASSIPFDDRTPVVYPPAKAWEELTIRRQKYKAVDLAPVSPEEEEIRRALSRPISFDFQDTPLSDIVDYLRDYTGVNVIPDLAAMEQVGVDLDTPVTLRLESVTLKSALRLLLRPLEMTYLVGDGVLQLTTSEVASRELITKVYPVGDLVTPIVNFQGGAMGLGGGGLGSQGGGFNAGGGGLGGQGNLNANNQDNGRGNRSGSPNRQPRGDGPELREQLREIIQQAGSGDAFFKNKPVSDEVLRAAVAHWVNQREHDKVVGMLRAALRNQTGQGWMHEAIALSLELHGGSPAETRDAFLSLVDLAPASLAVRRSVADTLAALGQPVAALALLRETAILEPESVKTYYDALTIARNAGNVEEAAWAADQLLSREWTPDGEIVPEETKRLLARFAADLRLEGKQPDADRLLAIAAAPRIRDLEITIHWAGESDVDLCVVEPGDLLCSPTTPRTVQGGVLTFDGPMGRERYVATQAFSGDYELLFRTVWGKPTANTIHVDVVKHKGTARESRERHAVSLADADPRLTVRLEGGRRTERTPIGPEEEWSPFRGEKGKEALSPKMQLQRRIAAQDHDERTVANANLLQPIAGPNGPLAQIGGVVGGVRPVVSAGAVAFEPEITVINNGPSLQVQAIVSHDRRYVRMTLIPVIQNVQALDQVRSVPVTGVAR